MEVSGIGMIGAALAVAIALFRIMSASRARVGDLARVERKLDAVIRHLGLEKDIGPKISSRVESLIHARQKIAAIKAYREENPGVGLAEAKSLIEELERERGLIR